MASAVSMGPATSAKIAGGLLDAYAALQLVPVDPSSTSTTSASSSSFGDTQTRACPEEENPSQQRNPATLMLSLLLLLPRCQHNSKP